MSFIPGYVSSMTVNGTELNLWSSAGGLTKTTEAIHKTTLGKTNREYKNGLKDTSMSVDMHLDTASLTLLQAADDATDPVACVFRPGALGANDAGQYAGEGIITSLDLTGSFDDNWTVSLEIQGSKAWPYTAPV